MTDATWRCAGCGIATPDRRTACDCATSVVYRRDTQEQALKIDAMPETAAQLIVALKDVAAKADDYLRADIAELCRRSSRTLEAAIMRIARLRGSLQAISKTRSHRYKEMALAALEEEPQP
jgi:phage gp36-like protein